MWRASLVALALVAGTARAARADAEPDDQPNAVERTGDTRTQLAQQLADEASALERTRAIVGDKLTAADAVRTHRLTAAYRALTGPTGAPEPMAIARRRAAARWLLERDLAERRLLADEATRLRGAAERTHRDAEKVPELVLPSELGRPAKGKVIRHYGTQDHERAKVALSRRGIDLDVDARSPVTAPADGTVRYAGPIRGLETGVVIDHGSYLTVIGKLGEVAVPVGARVARGDRIGRSARHRVYLEVRVAVGPGGLPIDPEPLLAKAR